MKLDTKVYTAFIKACGTRPSLVGHAHAAFKKMIWGPSRMKPNAATFVSMSRQLREAGRLHDALDVYLGMRRVGQFQALKTLNVVKQVHPPIWHQYAVLLSSTCSTVAS